MNNVIDIRTRRRRPEPEEPTQMRVVVGVQEGGDQVVVAFCDSDADTGYVIGLTPKSALDLAQKLKKTVKTLTAG